MEKKKHGHNRHWVVQQHDEMKLVESPTQPPTAVESGERAKRIHGPFPDKDTAQKHADKLESRTLRGQAGN